MRHLHCYIRELWILRRVRVRVRVRDFLNTKPVVRARGAASFWRENLVAIVILLRVLARMS